MITGAGRGIGRATAQAFAAEGYTVVLAELRRALGQRAERELVAVGARALFVRTDVADPVSVARSVRSALRRFRRIDCLVNNAGVLRVGKLTQLPLRDMDWMLDVNLRGPLLLVRALLPAMLRQGSGSIVNVAPLAIFRPDRGCRPRSGRGTQRARGRRPVGRYSALVASFVRSAEP